VNDWWDNGDRQIAFCRGGRGFIAFNNQYNTPMQVNLQVNIIVVMISNRKHEFR
jgi:hypothetical protein